MTAKRGVPNKVISNWNPKKHKKISYLYFMLNLYVFTIVNDANPFVLLIKLLFNDHRTLKAQ